MHTSLKIVLNQLKFSEPVAVALIQDGALWPDMLTNPYLPLAAWQAAFSHKMPVAQVGDLIANRLTHEALTWLILNERRLSIVAKGISAVQVLTAEHIRTLLSTDYRNRPGAGLIATAVLDRRHELAGTVPAADLAGMADGAGGLAQLVALGEFADETTALRWMGTFSTWAPSKQWHATARALELALARHPVLLTSFVHGPRAAQSIAAGHRHLTELPDALEIAALDQPWEEGHQFTLFKLLSNPAVPTEIASAIALKATERQDQSLLARATSPSRQGKHPVTQPWREMPDGEQLRFLVRRTLPSKFSTIGRPADVPELLGNPNLSSGHVTQLLAMMQGKLGTSGSHLAQAALAGDPNLAASLSARFGNQLAASQQTPRPPFPSTSYGAFVVVSDLHFMEEVGKDVSQDKPGSISRRSNAWMDDFGTYLATRLVHPDGSPHVTAWRTALGLLESFGDATIQEWVDTTLAVL